jgi:hypothetical protein
LKIHLNLAGFEVLAVLVMKSSIFLNITQHRPVKVNQCLLQVGFLLSLLFGSEDGGIMFPQTSDDFY